MNDNKLQVSPSIHEIGFLRLHQIIGRPAISQEEAEKNHRDAEAAKASGLIPNKKPKRPRAAVQALIPVSRSSWYEGIKTGKFPSPIKLGVRISVWKASDIRGLIEQSGNGGVT